MKALGSLIRGYAPFFNDEVSEFVIAVARGCGIALVQRQDQMGGISSDHKDPDIQHVSRGQHHLALPVRVLVGGVFVERHLGGEAALLGWNSQVNDTERETDHEAGSPDSYVYSVTCHFSS